MKSINNLITQMNQQTENQKKEKAKRDQMKESAPKKSAPSVSKKVEPPKVNKKEPKKEKTSFGNDLKAAGKAASQFFNPFDGVSGKEAVNNYLNRNHSKTFDEVARGANRVVDSASLGAMSNLDKKVNKREPYYNSERKIGEGGGTDMITTGLGYLVPGAGFVKGAKATRFGAKEGTKGIQKALQLGKEGAAVGFAMGATEVGIREALNGKDTDWKDNLKHIGFGTATGAIADPVIHGVGKGISKGFESASNKAMKNLVPDGNQLAETIAPILKPNEKLLNANVVARDVDNVRPREYTLPNGQKVKLKSRVENELNNTQSQINRVETEVRNYDQEYQEAIQRQFDYLKNSMGKGVDYGTTTSGSTGAGNFREINGSFSVSKNPKWYQDFYKLNSRRPNNKELWELAEQHVKEGFYDEGGSLPPWNPKKIQAIDDDIDNVVRLMGENPDQVEALQPILKALEEDRAAVLKSIEGNKTELEQLQNKQIELETTLGRKQPSLIPEVKQVEPNVLPLTKQSVEPPLVKPQAVPKKVEPINKEVETLLESEPIAPKAQEPKPNERRFYENVNKREKVSDEMKQKIADFDKTYVPMSNQETVDFANAYIKEDIEKAYQFVKNAMKFDPRHITVGHRLIDEFQAKGEYDRALDVIERLAEQGTKHGQSIQAYSIYGRLTAQGQLLRAQRIVNRINQSIPDPQKQVKLDESTIQDIKHAADSIQRLTGQEEVTNNVINIMESIKKGKMASDDELDMIRSFVMDAKKFIGDTTPKPERVKVKNNDVRTRDKVVNFMDGQEQAARERLRKAMKRANSLPVDMFYDLTVIGASKIAKGTVKFADFTEQMVQDFGEEIRPYMRQIWDKAAETFNLQSEKMTSKRLSEVEKIVNKATKEKSLTKEEAQAIQLYLNDYLQLTGDAKLEASMNLQATLQLLERPTFAGRLSTAQTIAQLLNPKTIVRNALGNELFYRVEQINKLVATPIDMAKSAITGSQRTVTFRTHNQGQYWHNWMMGLKAGWKGVNPMGLTTMYDLGPQAFRGKYNPLTYLEKSLGAVLRSFDHAGYMRAYNKSLGELATLRAMNEGLKGQAKKEAIARYIREADENMKQISDSYAKYATFQDNTMLATGLQKVKKGMNKVSTLGVTDEFGLGDLVLKYPKTPGNLIMRALEYSPAGLVRSAHLLKDFIRTKNPLDQRETIISFTRAITGTAGFSMMGYVLADMGILTSAGHSDYEVASLERNAGKQPNSVNITALARFVQSGFNMNEAKVKEGDTFVSYDWAQPVSLAIALGTGVNQSVKEEEEINPGKAAKKGFDSAANTVIEMSVLGGLNDFLANYPGRTFSDRVTDSAKGIASSFTPTFINQMRQLSDNTSRTTYSNNPYEEIGNKALNRVPGLQKSLPFAYDTLGNQRENFQNGSNNAFNVLLNPSFVSQYKPSEEAKFVVDFINRTGDKTVAPHIAPKKLDGIALTGEQQAKYQRIMGEETKKGLESLVPKAQGSTNYEKIKKSLEGILRDAGRKAREEIRKELN